MSWIRFYTKLYDPGSQRAKVSTPVLDFKIKKQKFEREWTWIEVIWCGAVRVQNSHFS